MNEPGMKWFGEAWGAPVCSPHSHTTTPLGEACYMCSKEIGVYDRGFILQTVLAEDNLAWLPVHLDCFLENLGLRMQGVGGEHGECGLTL
jgi:hypothetical protein